MHDLGCTTWGRALQRRFVIKIRRGTRAVSDRNRLIRAIISGASPITRWILVCSLVRTPIRVGGGRGGIIDAVRCGAAATGRGRYCVTLGPGESLDPGTNKRGGPWPYLRLTGFIRIRNEGIARSTVRCSHTWREPKKGSRFPATWVPIGCTPTRVFSGVLSDMLNDDGPFWETLGFASVFFL